MNFSLIFSLFFVVYVIAPSITQFRFWWCFAKLMFCVIFLLISLAEIVKAP